MSFPHPYLSVLALLLIALAATRASPNNHLPNTEIVPSNNHSAPVTAPMTRFNSTRRGQPETIPSNRHLCFRFFHRSPGGDTCLDVEQSRQKGGVAEAQLWWCTGNPAAQRIERREAIIRPGDTSLDYIVVEPNFCLDVPYGNAYAGQVLQWYPCNWQDNQQWETWSVHRYPDGDEPWNYKTFISPKGQRGRLCVDALGGFGNRRPGQRVGLWHCHEGPEQEIYGYHWNGPESEHCGR